MYNNYVANSCTSRLHESHHGRNEHEFWIYLYFYSGASFFLVCIKQAI